MPSLLNHKEHRLSEHKSFIQVLMTSILMMFGYAIVFWIMSVALVIPLLFFINREDIETVTYSTGIVVSLIIMVFYYWWFSPEYKWKPKSSFNAIQLTSPIIIYWFITFIVLFTVSAGHLTFDLKSATLSSILYVVGTGALEEIVFREIGISYMKRQLDKDKNEYNLVIVTITSFVFGVIHLFNALFDNDFFVHLFQVLLAFLFGIFLGCVFLRTGNIILCIVTHILDDMLILLFTAKLGANDIPTYIYIWMVIGQALLALWGLFLIRKKKHPEIKALWDEKWQITEFD